MFTGPIALGALRTSAVLGLRLIVQASTLLLVARMLGPEQFGVFAGVAALAVLMGAFATFGTHFVLLAEVSKESARRTEVLAYAVPTTLLSGSLLFILFILLMEFGFASLGVSMLVALCIGITEILVLPLFLFPANEQLALKKTASSQILVTFPLALRMLIALIVMLAAPEYPLQAFAVSYLLSAIAALLIIKKVTFKAWLSIGDWHMPSKAHLKHSVGYAALALTASGPSEIDKILAVKLLPQGLGGIYVAASRIIAATTYPVIALLLAAMPRLFYTNSSDAINNKQLTRLILALVFIYGVVLAGLLWQLAPVVEWLVGEGYTDIAQILKWICFAVPGLALRFAAGGILVTQERPWIRAGMELSGLLVLIACALLFVQHYDWRGMPMALAVSEYVMVVYFFIFGYLKAAP